MWPGNGEIMTARPQIDFSGQVAVVTGAGRGLGREYALALARRGAKLVVNDIGASVEGTGASKIPAEEVVAQIRRNGGQAVADFTDVSSRNADHVVETALNTYGGIDILINNAGRLEHHPFEDLPEESLQATLDVHLTGTFRVTRSAYRAMKERGYGRIVMTTSQVGFFGKAGSSAYGIAKMATLGMLATLKLEAPAHGIHVNAISPFAATRMSEKSFSPDALRKLGPEQVAAAVLVLCDRGYDRSGDILIAGGGHFSMAHMVETAGIDFDDLDAISAESVAARISQISDDRRTRRFDDALQAVGGVIERVSGLPSQPPAAPEQTPD